MDDRERYFLNGNWIIDWSGRYQSASGGVGFRYERSGDAETLVSLTSSPLQHDLIVMVCSLNIYYSPYGHRAIGWRGIKSFGM